jgi:HEPN domain
MSPRPLVDPKLVYEQGLRFLVAESRLRSPANVDDFGKILGIPAAVLNALADELFLKAMLLIEGKTSPRTHNLAKLFQLLEPDTKTRIEILWDASALANKHNFAKHEARHNITVPRDLRSALDSCGDFFEKGRYIYEDPSSVRFWLSDLPPILKSVVLTLKPEWK